MWLPKTETEIIKVVQSGSLEETAIFDAKEELSKNSEIAKDIAAMANDGGVIIYGIGEDEHGRITRLTPLSIDGQAEKIDAIVRSSITEPLVIHISSIPTEENPAVGYLIVYIPPSERAPHMVVVKGDHRFYGRSATGNYPLPEGEVARLYARRQHIEIDRENFLDVEIKSAPYGPNSNFGYLFLFARPLFARDKLLDPCLKNGKNFQTILNDLIEIVIQPSIFPQNIIYLDFQTPQRWIRRAEGFLGQLCQPSKLDLPEAPGDTLNIEVEFNGTMHLFCGRIAQKEGNRFLFFPEDTCGLTLRFMNFIASLYEQAGYIGMVDIGLAITGIKGTVPCMPRNFRFDRIAVPYDRDTYRKTTRASALTIRKEPIEVSKDLIMPLISAITLNHLDPFEKLAK